MRLAPVLLALSLLVGPAFAQRTLDQVSDYHNSAYKAAIAGLVWEQEVQVGPSRINVNDHVAVDMMPSGISFQAGDWFIIRIRGDSQGMGFQGNSYWPNDPYPGDFYLNGNPVGSTDNMGFRTWTWTGPSLEVIGSCPGPITIVAARGTPGGSMAMLHSAPGAFTQNNPARPCLGIQLGLAAPVFAGVLQLDGAGGAALNLNLPPAACGRALQLVDLATCVPTAALQL